MLRDKEITLENLIKVLQILNKYGNPSYPIQCEHEALRVYGIHTIRVNDEDIEELANYGFIIDEINDCFISYAYGSC
jgi:hypothetical protein